MLVVMLLWGGLGGLEGAGRLRTVKTEHCVESAGAELDHNKLVCRETYLAHTPVDKS